MLRLENSSKNALPFFQTEWASLVALGNAKIHLGLEKRTMDGRKQLIAFTMTPANRVNVIFGFTYNKEVTPATHRVRVHVNMGSSGYADFIRIDDMKERLRGLGFSESSVDLAAVELCGAQANC